MLLQPLMKQRLRPRSIFLSMLQINLTTVMNILKNIILLLVRDQNFMKLVERSIVVLAGGSKVQGGHLLKLIQRESILICQLIMIIKHYWMISEVLFWLKKNILRFGISSQIKEHLIMRMIQSIILVGFISTDSRMLR